MSKPLVTWASTATRMAVEVQFGYGPTYVLDESGVLDTRWQLPSGDQLFTTEEHAEQFEADYVTKPEAEAEAEIAVDQAREDWLTDLETALENLDVPTELAERILRAMGDGNA